MDGDLAGATLAGNATAIANKATGLGFKVKRTTLRERDKLQEADATAIAKVTGL